MATGQADLISNLPDDVLGTIISLLHTRDGCRTQALSRRWRPIWRAAPLNLEGGGSRLREQTVSGILSGHLGPVRRISIFMIKSLPRRYDLWTGHPIVDDTGDARVDSWLGSRDLAHLEELRLSYEYNTHNSTLPPSVFSSAPALRVASFGRCRLPPNLAVDFPLLQQLTLWMVTLTQEALNAVLSGCPALESLGMTEIRGVVCLRIRSRTLRSIGFRHSSYVPSQELVIEDAPCLERARLQPFGTDNSVVTFRVIHAPKLEMFSQLMNTVRLTTTMHTVKILELEGVGDDLDPVLDLSFLKFFPCLERLYIYLNSEIWFSHPLSKNVRTYVSLDDPIECLEHRLKKVALKIYNGKGPIVDFARFLILNAKVLERMEIGLDGNHDDEWMANEKRKLRVEDRASQDAQFEFKRSSWSFLAHMGANLHYMSKTDPFYTFFDGYVAL
ncbi:putative F-box/LRR-repeat protein At3g28410 [Triticum aestivum]|uniref:putative F-box/LRR-repeat protein At3g28410 n=1 Tax=Triticum aestivum TaxID=4565 RepID=UPI001D01F591|nr:putative F-box/LRR-repeat protein At3g28410 [Triticum aestivum]